MWHAWGRGKVHTELWWGKWGKGSTWRLRCRWSNNIRMILKAIGWGAQYRARADSCERSHKTSGSIKIGEFRDWGTVSISQSTILYGLFLFSSHGTTALSGPGPPYYRGFTITLGHTTLGRTALDEWSARRRDPYLTTHNTHKRQTSMPLAGFEPTVPASERPQTYASVRAASLGLLYLISLFITLYVKGVTVCRLVSINYLLIGSGSIISRWIWRSGDRASW